jgi:hypothetical protein
MKTDSIKKGQRVLLRCGWQGTMADNGKGDTRIVNVEGAYRETSSVYSHDLVKAKSAAGKWVPVEHTLEQDTLRELVGGLLVERGS